MCYEELDLVDKLRILQTLKKLKQVELGERLQVSQPVISRVMRREHKPSYELEQRIIKLLKENKLY
jgi:transcriptional regulator with XRE-family HTH domain